MNKSHRECSIRLLIGLLLNLVIVIPAFGLAGMRQFVQYADFPGFNLFQVALIGGIVAAFSLVLIVRVLRHGASWQQIIAIILLLMPAIMLADLFLFSFRFLD